MEKGFPWGEGKDHWEETSLEGIFVVSSPQPGLLSLPSQLQGGFASPVSPRLCSVLHLLQCSWSQTLWSWLISQMSRPLLLAPASMAVSWEWYWEHLSWETLGGQDWGSQAWTDLRAEALLLLPAPFEDMAWGLDSGCVQSAPEGATLTV